VRPFHGRVIASTQNNLLEKVQAGEFRKDLFFRLAVGKVHLPPLRTRKVDLPVLSRALMTSQGVDVELTAQMLSLLEGYDWPGNVRELRNVIERGSVMQRTGESSWLELILGGKPKTRVDDSRSVLQLAAQMSYADAKDRVMLDFDRHYFEQVLKECKNDVKAAMARTGLSLPSLYRLFKRVGIRIKDLRNPEG
jgi:two-component system, NtrC family, response regulator GlrR